MNMMIISVFMIETRWDLGTLPLYRSICVILLTFRSQFYTQGGIACSSETPASTIYEITKRHVPGNINVDTLTCTTNLCVHFLDTVQKIIYIY
jgi:hypothetical protein